MRKQSQIQFRVFRCMRHSKTQFPSEISESLVFISVHPCASVVPKPSSVFICVHQWMQSYLSANVANAIYDFDMQASILESTRWEN